MGGWVGGWETDHCCGSEEDIKVLKEGQPLGDVGLVVCFGLSDLLLALL